MLNQLREFVTLEKTLSVQNIHSENVTKKNNHLLHPLKKTDMNLTNLKDLKTHFRPLGCNNNLKVDTNKLIASSN